MSLARVDGVAWRGGAVCGTVARFWRSWGCNSELASVEKGYGCLERMEGGGKSCHGGMVKTYGGLVGVSSVLVEGCNNGGVVAIVRREVQGASCGIKVWLAFSFVDAFFLYYAMP